MLIRISQRQLILIICYQIVFSEKTLRLLGKLVKVACKQGKICTNYQFPYNSSLLKREAHVSTKIMKDRIDSVRIKKINSLLIG